MTSSIRTAVVVSFVAVAIGGCKVDGGLGEDQSAVDSTADCGCGGAPSGQGGAGGSTSVSGCTLTQGYWKNHPDAWPVASLELGGVSYTEAELIALLETPPRGDSSLILAHQLIAAKLNVAAGASVSSEVDSAISDADAWLAANADADGRLPFGVKDEAATALADTLDAFNNGQLGPAECGETSTSSTATTGAGGSGQGGSTTTTSTTTTSTTTTSTSASTGGAGGCNTTSSTASASSSVTSGTTGGWSPQ